MTLQSASAGALEYYPCRYGASRVLFRGPRKRLNGRYLAFLGGTDTYGRFIPSPFPALVERRLGVACVNLGAVNAGVDLYLNDPSVLDTAAGAEVKVLQLLGAQNMSNRYYQVHPRRNDRFLRASERLETLFPEVDFTEFNFVRHMLGHLAGVSGERFATVVEELRTAWVARMKHIVTLLRGPIVLVWFSGSALDANRDAGLAGDPLYINRDMVEALRPRVSAVLEVPLSEAARLAGSSGMVFGPLDACAAAELLGPGAHEEAAAALETALRPLLRPQS